MPTSDTFIAVVDDESPMRTMLGRVLRLAGHRAVAFDSGEDFLASLHGQLPACAVLDIHMPGMSGLEVQAHLRHAQMPIPVIFITASADATLDKAAHELGVSSLLRKPFSSDVLLARIDEALAASS